MGDPGPSPNQEAIGRGLTYKLGSTGTLPRPTVTEYVLPDIADTTAPPETIERGKVLFLDQCSWCHGYDAIGNGSFPDLRYSSAATHSIWNAIVLDGAYLSRGMPAFGDIYTEDDAQAIRAFVVRQGRLTLDAQE